MRKRAVFLVICSLCLIVLPQGNAAIAETIAVTTGMDDPPFTDHTRNDGGTATQLVLKVFRTMGYQIKLDWLPWRRGYSLTRSGAYQASFPYLRTEERERDFLFSDPIYSDASYLWTRAGDTLSLDDLTGFKGKIVCIPQGFHSPLLVVLSAMIERQEVRVERADTPEKCVQMLAAGRVDALSGQELEIEFPLRANGLTGKIAHGPTPLMKLDFHVIFPKSDSNSADLVRRFNEALARMRDDGSYARLMSN